MNKIKYTCGIPTQATCVTTEVTPNTQSALIEESCLVQEDVNQDIYDQLEDVRSEIDLSALGDLCLNYTLESGKIIVKNALLKYEQEICDLKSKIEQLENRKICDTPITECLSDFDCLVADCDNSIVTLKDWMLAIQNKVCTP